MNKDRKKDHRFFGFFIFKTMRKRYIFMQETCYQLLFSKKTFSHQLNIKITSISTVRPNAIIDININCIIEIACYTLNDSLEYLINWIE